MTYDNDFNYQTINVTTTDGKSHTFERARFLGIWSGRVLITAPQDVAKHTESPDKLQSYDQTAIPVADVARLELGVGDNGDSDTRVELEAAGHLGEDDELAPA